MITLIFAITFGITWLAIQILCRWYYHFHKKPERITNFQIQSMQEIPRNTKYENKKNYPLGFWLSTTFIKNNTNTVELFEECLRYTNFSVRMIMYKFSNKEIYELLKRKMFLK